MAFTKAQIRTRVKNKMDAVNSTRWDFTANGEVDEHIAFVVDKEWRRILNANRYYRCDKRTPTSDSSGRFLISDLTSGTAGAAHQRFYRVLAVLIDSQPYLEGELVDMPLATTNGSPTLAWYRVGDYIQAIPVQAAKVATGIWVNHIPYRFNDATVAEGATFIFPDGYEDIVVLESAAALLAKGGTETNTSVELKAFAREMRDEMLSDIQRFSTKPMAMRYDDSRGDWGG